MSDEIDEMSLTILCKILYLFGRPAEMSELLFW